MHLQAFNIIFNKCLMLQIFFQISSQGLMYICTLMLIMSLFLFIDTTDIQHCFVLKYARTSV